MTVYLGMPDDDSDYDGMGGDLSTWAELINASHHDETCPDCCAEARA